MTGSVTTSDPAALQEALDFAESLLDDGLCDPIRAGRAALAALLAERDTLEAENQERFAQWQQDVARLGEEINERQLRHDANAASLRAERRDTLRPGG